MRPDKIFKRVLILCEGDSETNYLTSYRSDDGNRRRLSGTEIDIYQPKNFSPIGLVKEAKKRVKESKKEHMLFDCAWVVFDKDGHYGVPDAFQLVADHNNAAKLPQIHIAFSARCFEMWLALHFERRKLYFANGDAAKDHVRTLIPGYNESFKAYKHLKEHDISREKAKANAIWLRNQGMADINLGRRLYDLDSWCDFDELMDYLDQV